MSSVLHRIFHFCGKLTNDPSRKRYDLQTISREGSVFEVDCFTLSEILLKRVVPKIGIHPYPLNEQMLMAAAVAFVKPRMVIEWGTHFGKSARLFWEVSKALGLPSQIYTIDLMAKDHPEFPGTNVGKYISGTDVKQLIGSGIEKARNLLEGVCAPVIVYIDGDHSRKSTQLDLEIWNNLPSSSGILAHDVFFQSPSSYNIGPWQSFQELLQEQGKSIAHIQWQLMGLPGMVLAIKKK